MTSADFYWVEAILTAAWVLPWSDCLLATSALAALTCFNALTTAVSAAICWAWTWARS